MRSPLLLAINIRPGCCHRFIGERAVMTASLPHAIVSEASVGGFTRVEPGRPRGLESFQSPPDTGGRPMPHYEFFCHACKKSFSKVLSLVDCEEGEVLCPHCGSKEVEQCWSAFSAITSKKSA